jgi:23S rRNA (adenine-N6)-dimethyltransferase
MRKSKYRYSNKKLSRGEPPNFSGQHLMHNKKTIQEIISKSAICQNETIVELGAGKGALTESLAKKSGNILAVEYDKKYVDVLQRKFMRSENVKVIQQDIMKFRLPKKKFVVISNIPYAITTPILKMLLSNPISGFQRGVIVMERGAAKRFTAKYFKDPYVLAWRMWFDLKLEKGVPKEHFSPPPKVDSAILSIKRIEEPMIAYKDALLFQNMINYVLKYPHAPIGLALKGIFTVPQLKRLRKNMGVNNETPVGSLNEMQWAVVFETMIAYVSPSSWPKRKK